MQALKYRELNNVDISGIKVVSSVEILLNKVHYLIWILIQLFKSALYNHKK